MLRRYNNTIQEQIQTGIMEDVPADAKPSTQAHYFPHHAVVRTDKSTTKLQTVYDASAKTNGHPSLKECLPVGPKFNQKLLNILVRFQTHHTAETANIEKVLLVVLVKESDRDALRFLWVHNVEYDPPRFIHLPFFGGFSPSPFLSNATIKHHLECYRESHPDLIQLLLDSYADLQCRLVQEFSFL